MLNSSTFMQLMPQAPDINSLYHFTAVQLNSFLLANETIGAELKELIGTFLHYQSIFKALDQQKVYSLYYFLITDRIAQSYAKLLDFFNKYEGIYASLSENLIQINNEHNFNRLTTKRVLAKAIYQNPESVIQLIEEFKESIETGNEFDIEVLRFISARLSSVVVELINAVDNNEVDIYLDLDSVETQKIDRFRELINQYLRLSLFLNCINFIESPTRGEERFVYGGLTTISDKHILDLSRQVYNFILNPSSANLINRVFFNPFVFMDVLNDIKEDKDIPEFESLLPCYKNVAILQGINFHLMFIRICSLVYSKHLLKHLFEE